MYVRHLALCLSGSWEFKLVAITETNIYSIWMDIFVTYFETLKQSSNWMQEWFLDILALLLHSLQKKMFKILQLWNSQIFSVFAHILFFLWQLEGSWKILGMVLVQVMLRGHGMPVSCHFFPLRIWFFFTDSCLVSSNNLLFSLPVPHQTLFSELLSMPLWSKTC